MGAAMQRAHITRHSDTEGFTLVEVVIGMTLMAIVFTAAFGSYFLGMRMVEDAREELRASQIIQSELERMRTMNWATLNDPNKTFQLAAIKPQGDFVSIFANDYKGYRFIDDLDFNSDGIVDAKLVHILVQWRNSRGLYTYEIFNTIIVREGLNDYYYRKV